jgi:hypothetical protein
MKFLVLLGVVLGILLNKVQATEASAPNRPLILEPTASYDLKNNGVRWTFQAKGWKRWLPADGGPLGSVTWDLVRNGVIQHPYIGKNALASAWVGDCTWVYRADFDVTNLLGDSKFMQYGHDLALVMSGVDTYGSLWLNGKRLISLGNPHRTYTVRLTSQAAQSTSQEPVFEFGTQHSGMGA